MHTLYYTVYYTLYTDIVYTDIVQFTEQTP